MKKGLQTINIALVVVATVLLTACGTSKNAAVGTTTGAASHSCGYVRQVLSNAVAQKALTAKMKLIISTGEKDISLSGSLKMMRGDVIQLSATFPLIGEVCRMEFTKSEVLIIDRINTRYIRVPYSEVDFLKSANLDFNSLESLFWNEIFYPGEQDVKHKIEDFRVSSAGSHTLLSLTTAPKLDYAFLTQTDGALLDRITVSSKNLSDHSNLTCIYGDFKKFGSSKFPASISMSFVGESQTYGLDMTLSSLDNSTNWNTRTTVSPKYKQIDANKLFKNLIP